MLSFVDSSGKEVLRLPGGLKNSREADSLADYLSGRHYTRVSLSLYVEQKQ
jgi:hypothetical protein